MDRDTNKENNNQSGDKLKQNLVHKGGQAAATYFGGSAGKEAYDAASKTELGQKLEKAVSNKITSSNNSIPSLNQSNPSIGLDKNQGLSEKEEANSDDKNNKNGSNSFNNDNSDGEDSVNSSESIIAKFKKIPAPIKGAIFTTSGYFLVFLSIIIVVAIIAGQTASIAENLFEKLNFGNGDTSEFFNDDGNYFADEKDSKVEKAEKAYYKKLQDVYEEFKRKYNVAIDTTMITATLFYNRNIGDYGDEDGIEDVENNTDTSNPAFDDDKFYEDEAVEFYKLAKRHIKTLAKYMLIQETTFNACVDTKDQELYAIKPYTPKNVADNWTTISTWKFGDQRTWNSRNTFYYTEKEEKTYTKADGTTNTIKLCSYLDLDTQLNQYYVEDRTIYLDRKEKYDTCVNNAKAACRSGCPGCIDTSSPQCPYCKDCDDRQTCISGCNSANYDNVCAAEKKAYQEAERIYRDNWTNEGMYDDNGFKACVPTTKWAKTAQTYDDTNRYMNYPFDLDLVNKADTPNFLHYYEYMINRNSPIKCSNEPAISYRYEIDTSEEGVYYYKLMAKTPKNILDFIKDDSFIERYYPELIDTSTEESREKTIKNVVDEIFLLYDTVVEREKKYCYTPGTSNNTGVSGGTSGVVSTSRTEFINSIANDAIKDMENTGILASITIAQAILESGNGGSSLAKTYNNYYGMTAGSCAPKRPTDTNSRVVSPGKSGNSCTGNAYWDGTVVWMCNSKGADCQWYRVYDSFIKSTHDHSRLLSTSHYSCQGIFDPNQAIACIQAGGYATDPQYQSKVMSIINGNNLTQFDIGEWNGEIITDYSGNGLGTVCYTTAFERELALGNQIANGEGTINGLIGNVRTKLYGTPEYMTYWGSNNNIFHASGYDKECTWYANGRGMEILVSNGMSLAQAKQYMRPMHGNAGKWFGQNQYFSSSVNVNAPKVGAIIVWSNGSKPGHVAIIENIHYDGAGNPVSVDISHGGQSLNGFQYATNKSISWVASHSTYRFVGYVYLLG